MAFCRNCGTDMGGARFCPNCGAAVSGEAVAQYSAPTGMSPRKQTLAEFDHLMNHFGPKQKWYDDYSAVTAEIEELSKGAGNGWIGAGVISVIIGLFGDSFFLFLAIAAGFVALGILAKKKNKKKLETATTRQAKISKKLIEHYEAYGDCPVGFNYTNPIILQAMYELVRDGRANTISEALNRLLDDMKQEEMHRLQVEATEAAKDAAKNSREAATFSAASFFFKD